MKAAAAVWKRESVAKGVVSEEVAIIAPMIDSELSTHTSARQRLQNTCLYVEDNIQSIVLPSPIFQRN